MPVNTWEFLSENFMHFPGLRGYVSSSFIYIVEPSARSPIQSAHDVSVMNKSCKTRFDTNRNVGVSLKDTKHLLRCNDGDRTYQKTNPLLGTMDVDSGANSNHGNDFSLLYLQPLDHHYQIWFQKKNSSQIEDIRDGCFLDRHNLTYVDLKT